MLIWRWRLQALLGVLIFGTVLGLAIALEPATQGHGTHEQLGLPPCQHLVRTGEPCMSCGMTTAFAFTVRGRFLPAIEANAMGLVLCLLTVLGFAWSARCLVRARDPLAWLYGTSWGRWVPIALVALILAHHYLRLAFWADTWGGR